MNTNKISRTLSLVLRHDPGSIGLTLDPEGWAEVHELLSCLAKNRKEIDRSLLEEVVTGSNNQRFRFSDDGSRIRANQGHSIDIALKFTEQAPPDLLYHGTADKFMTQIEQEGLKKMSRQHVHLSADMRTAHDVSMRHGKPIILEIGSRSMDLHSFKFYLSEDGVWLTDHVPPDYLNHRFSI